MIDLNNIHSLTDFNRNSKQAVRRLKKSGKPEVLTVNGQAELVVQSAASYQKLLEQVELVDTLAGLKRGLEQADRRELRPASTFFKEIAAKYGVVL